VFAQNGAGTMCLTPRTRTQIAHPAIQVGLLRFTLCEQALPFAKIDKRVSVERLCSERVGLSIQLTRAKSVALHLG
jgi:hypothetical protein